MTEEDSTLKAEVEKLQAEFSQLKTAMQSDRVTRAEQHIGNMRNWLSFYTGFVTLIFLLFGFFGFRSYSDIQSSRDRVDVEAARVQKTAQDFYAEVDAMKAQLKATDALAAHTNLAATNLQGQFTAFGLGQPTVFLSGLFTVGKNIMTTVNGANLGTSIGNLYVRAEPGGTVDAFTQTSLEPIEIGKDSIREWKDDSIKFVASAALESALRQAKSRLDAEGKPQTSALLNQPITSFQTLPIGLSAGGPVLAIKVKTANGVESLWVSTNFWPVLDR